MQDTQGNGELAFNVMRKMAMALFKQDTTKSASMARKRKMAGLNDAYRSTLFKPGVKCASLGLSLFNDLKNAKKKSHDRTNIFCISITVKNVFEG